MSALTGDDRFERIVNERQKGESKVNNMNETVFYTFLDKRKQAVQAEIDALSGEGRKDEANILKAKFNVYDISRSVFNVNAKKAGDDAAEAFMASFSKITEPWTASLEAAKAHNDDRRILIEEAKLQAVEEINAKVADLK